MRSSVSSMSSGTLLAQRAQPPPSQQTVPPNSIATNNASQSSLLANGANGAAAAAAAAAVAKSYNTSVHAANHTAAIGNHHQRSTPTLPQVSTAIGSGNIGSPSFSTFPFTQRAPQSQQQQPQLSQLPQQQQQSQQQPHQQQSTIGAVQRAGYSESAAALINDSEFPSLNMRSSPIQPPPPHHPSPMFSLPLNLSSMFGSSNKEVAALSSAFTRMPYANMMRGVADGVGYGQPAEWTLQSDEFPALPGAMRTPISTLSSAMQAPSSTLSNAMQAPTMMLSSSVMQAPISTAPPPLPQHASTSESSRDAKPGIETHSDGSVSNIPPGMLCDQFGMAGLISFIRSADKVPGLVAISLGTDISKLGMNFNSKERNLYQTFGGPWGEMPCATAKDAEVKVPEEYLTNHMVRDKLPSVKMAKLTEDLLFYIFYNSPGQVYQLAAASELYQRDWRYHMGKCVWITRLPYAVAKEVTADYELGSYNVFDPNQWRKVPQEMKLEFKMLENRPTPVNIGINSTTPGTSSGGATAPP